MSVAEKRTQLYFPRVVFQALERLAAQERCSVAELVRRAVRTFLQTRRVRIDWKRDPIWKVVGLFDSGDRDLSIHHDAYLYGRKRPPPRQG